MPTKLSSKDHTKGGVMAQYREDVEEPFVAGDEAETDSVSEGHYEGNGLQVEEETAEEVEEHDEVSSDETMISEADVESSAYGMEQAPAGAESGLELEPYPDYDEAVLEADQEGLLQQPGETRLLDAWYAEFADPVVRTLIQQQPNLMRSAAEVVIGRDDRVRITNTRAYPWRTICSLLITAKDGSAWIGTGWLVGHRTLITAGHVVYMHSRGGWVKRIEVIPGRNAATRPYGSCISTSFRSVKGWTNSKKRSHDYGAILLPQNCTYGKRLGYFGYANLSGGSLLGLNVNLSGYPGDKPSGTQWWHARRIKFVTARTLVYNIDTAGGQSGSPVWRLKNGKRHAVGIHTNGSSGGNSATRITKPVFNNIKKWKAEGM